VNGTFLSQIWAKSIADRFNQNLVLADILNSTAYWADNVPHDEGDFDVYVYHCQACQFI